MKSEDYDEGEGVKRELDSAWEERRAWQDRPKRRGMRGTGIQDHRDMHRIDDRLSEAYRQQDLGKHGRFVEKLERQKQRSLALYNSSQPTLPDEEVVMHKINSEQPIESYVRSVYDTLRSLRAKTLTKKDSFQLLKDIQNVYLGILEYSGGNEEVAENIFVRKYGTDELRTKSSIDREIRDYNPRSYFSSFFSGGRKRKTRRSKRSNGRKTRRSRR
jgi:hypothetical protein